MINYTWLGSGGFIHMILGIFLLLQPFQKSDAQVAGNYKLGPQLIPIEVKESEHQSHHPGQSALTSNCENSDFSSGDWSRWQGCYGNFNNSCQTIGFKTTNPHPLHVLIPAPGKY